MEKLTQEQASFWLAEIKSSEERKIEELKKKNHYPDIIKYYEGEQNSDRGTPMAGDKQKKLANLNEYHPNTNALINQILYQNPDVTAEATKPQAEEGAPVMKSAVQYAYDKLEANDENKLATFDMLYAGFCGVEVNHQVERPKPQQEGVIEKFGAFLTGQDKTEAEMTKDMVSQEDMYSMNEETYIKRWNPLNFGFDYRADRVKEIRFVYKIIRYTYAEFIEKYPDYQGKIKTGGVVPYSHQADDKYNKLVILYELQLKKKKNVYETIVLAPSYPHESLDRFERPFTTNGFDIKIGTLDEYGALYPKSRAALNKPVQDDINEYVSFMMEVAERNIPKRGYNSTKVKVDGIDQLNNNKVNANVPVKDGNPNDVWPIPHTNVSIENKELIGMFEKTKERLWGISASRLQGSADVQFATELQIQEAGFQEKTLGLQMGLQKLIRAEVNSLKDIIVTFWDNEVFFKITGEQKPTWYEPEIGVNPLTGESMVLNPLTEILTMDYDIKVDIVSAFKPNKERRKKEIIEYLTWLVQTVYPVLLMPQGLTINVEEIKKSAKEFGFNPENLITQVQIGNNLPMSGMPLGGSAELPVNAMPQV